MRIQWTQTPTKIPLSASSILRLQYLLLCDFTTTNFEAKTRFRCNCILGLNASSLLNTEHRHKSGRSFQCAEICKRFQEQYLYRSHTKLEIRYLQHLDLTFKCRKLNYKSLPLESTTMSLNFFVCGQFDQVHKCRAQTIRSKDPGLHNEPKQSK